MKISKEKIQYIFIYIALTILVLVISFLAFFFVSDHMKWQGYKNDENKRVFYERIIDLKAKLKTEKSYENYLDLGNAYYTLEEYYLAEKAYREAIGIVHRDSLAYGNLGDAYREQGKYEKAENSYLEVLDFKPKETKIYIDLHDLYKIDWEGKKYDSVSILLKGIEIMPNETDLINKLAVYYRDSGNIKKAIEYFEKSLEINSENELVINELNRLKK